MNDNKRSYEALSLRKFFDDQIHHLQQLVDAHFNAYHQKASLTKEDRQFVESFVDAANSKMRAVPGYTHKLREHVRGVYAHVLDIAEQIPPPVELTPTSFRTDSLINALFVCSEDLDPLLRNNPEVNAYLRSYAKTEVPAMYALLSASKSEKRTLGIGLQGSMLIREVPQQVINFSSHKIHTPCRSSEELSKELRKYLFDTLVALIKREMSDRMNQNSLQTSQASYEERVNSLANPNVYLDTLVEYLESPDQLLGIEKTHFKLNKMGIKIDGNDEQCANEFDIHELTWNGHSRNILLQIAYAR